jgi:hypothetical protein
MFLLPLLWQVTLERFSTVQTLPLIGMWFPLLHLWSSKVMALRNRLVLIYYLLQQVKGMQGGGSSS